MGIRALVECLLKIVMETLLDSAMGFHIKALVYIEYVEKKGKRW